MNQDDHDINLAGPCGIYCGTCRHYLARAKGMLEHKHLKHGCRGCRTQNKNCAWVKKGCQRVRKGQVSFCHACTEFPCDALNALNDRHVDDYSVNIIDNLHKIRDIGAEAWLQEQTDLWRCPSCRGSLCVMDRECYDCGYTW